MVDLGVGVSPPISNSHSLEVQPVVDHKCIVFDDFGGKSRDVVTCKGLASDVERTLLQGWPLSVKVVQKVEKVICSNSGRVDQRKG